MGMLESVAVTPVFSPETTAAIVECLFCAFPWPAERSTIAGGDALG